MTSYELPEPSWHDRHRASAVGRVKSRSLPGEAACGAWHFPQLVVDSVKPPCGRPNAAPAPEKTRHSAIADASSQPAALWDDALRKAGQSP